MSLSNIRHLCRCGISQNPFVFAIGKYTDISSDLKKVWLDIALEQENWWLIDRILNLNFCCSWWKYDTNWFYIDRTGMPWECWSQEFDWSVLKYIFHFRQTNFEELRYKIFLWCLIRDLFNFHLNTAKRIEQEVTKRYLSKIKNHKSNTCVRRSPPWMYRNNKKIRSNSDNSRPENTYIHLEKV